MMRTAVSFVAVASALGSSPTKCGKHWGYFINAGESGVVTLHYGTPVTLYDIGYPTTAGCAPENAYYTESNTGPPVKVSMSYVPETLSNIPLVEKALANSTSVASYEVTYEKQIAGMQFGLRPKTVTIQENPGVNLAELKYDDKGRVTYVNWTYANLKAVTGIPCKQKMTSPPYRYCGKTHGAKASTHGYERYVYDDAKHPLHATYYEAQDADGFSSVGYTYESNEAGLITHVVAFGYEATTTCPSACTAGQSCCTMINSNMTGTCYSQSCRDIDVNTWDYGYENGQVAAMNETGQGGGIVEYDYDSDGRLVSWSQGPLTIFNASFAGDHLLFQILFVIYPDLPLIWSFDPPNATIANTQTNSLLV